MRIIKKLAEQINDEVDGAIDYATLNISFPAVARQCGRCCNTVFTLGINASATVNNFAAKAKKTD